MESVPRSTLIHGTLKGEVALPHNTVRRRLEETDKMSPVMVLKDMSSPKSLLTITRAVPVGTG